MRHKIVSQETTNKEHKTFDLIDARGRVIGLWIRLGTMETRPYNADTDNSWHNFDLPTGHLFTAYMHGTRNGEEYGPGQNDHHFTTTEKRDQFVTDYIARAEKRMARKFKNTGGTGTLRMKEGVTGDQIEQVKQELLEQGCTDIQVLNAGQGYLILYREPEEWRGKSTQDKLQEALAVVVLTKAHVAYFIETDPIALGQIVDALAELPNFQYVLNGLYDRLVEGGPYKDRVYPYVVRLLDKVLATRATDDPHADLATDINLLRKLAEWLPLSSLEVSSDDVLRCVLDDTRRAVIQKISGVEIVTKEVN